MKQTKTRALMLLTFAGLLSTSLYANCGEGKQGLGGQEGEDYKCPAHMKKDGPYDGKMERGNKGDRKKAERDRMIKRDGDEIFSILPVLNLSKEQREQIGAVKREMKQNRPSVAATFSADGFDKKAYLDILENKDKQRFKNKADLTEKVFNILTPDQRKQLKTFLEMKEKDKSKDKGPDLED